jgi:DNA-binding GntR family transcriptional regulator
MDANVLSVLASDRSLLERSSTSERVAHVLRERITHGYLPSATRLSEQKLASALNVSRSTLREAFRMLIQEGLVLQRPNKGVFVRTPTKKDVRDLCRARLIIECGVLRDFGFNSSSLAVVEASVLAGEAAVKQNIWQDFGDCYSRFHISLAAVADSARIDDLMRCLLAEVQLAFHHVGSPRRIFGNLLLCNREILVKLQGGDVMSAERSLSINLQEAHRQLIAEFEKPV